MYCNKQATKTDIKAGRDAKCEKCGRWGHPFDMDYDDDTGFICEAARDECDKIMNDDEEKQCADCDESREEEEEKKCEPDRFTKEEYKLMEESTILNAVCIYESINLDEVLAKFANENYIRLIKDVKNYIIIIEKFHKKWRNRDHEDTHTKLSIFLTKITKMYKKKEELEKRDDEDEERCEICDRNAYHQNDYHCSQGLIGPKIKEWFDEDQETIK